MGLFPSKQERLLASYVPIYRQEFEGRLRSVYLYEPEDTYLPLTIASAHESATGFARRTLGISFALGQHLSVEAYAVCVRQVIPSPYRSQYENRPPLTVDEALALQRSLPKPESRPDMYLPRYREEFVRRLDELNNALPQVAYSPPLIGSAHRDASLRADRAARIADSATRKRLALQAYAVCVRELIPEPHRREYQGKPPPEPY